MSEYSFGFDPTDDQSDLGETNDQQQGPKWFRDGLAKLSGQVKALEDENSRLKAAQVKNQVADALKAKGYAPSAATLYTGEPDKLDDWLTAHGGALAKLPADGQEQGEEQPPGTPVSTVPADGQDALQRMQEAGTQGVAPPQGTDKELAAALKAANPEQFAALMRANGSQHDWTSF
ncbi:hypothetical protein AS594_07110 [Streptomyces agglomeratus]|uniref:Scaffolding protein n=1 Tax=Streptomyces agglomeratus TaxID=285458 RepID=A0A1E5P416_9ACTN|nr:hypothetical protein [Streptomyces agglomeratus]OEJ24291.1 hypothetical protein AS594_07110 [Streptomyces agglomeratus]